MKKLFILFLITFVLLTFSCRDKTSTIPVNSQSPAYNIPDASLRTEKVSSSSKSRFSDTPNEQPALKIPLSSGNFLITVIQTNLDLDTEDEQIVVYKKNNGKNDPIYVMVIDFDTIRNKYVISWQYETYATNVRSFTLSLLDVTGDHNLEIICRGSDGNSNQTINIFKRSTHINEYGLLSYLPILSLKENGNIEIQEEHRSQAYRTGVTIGKSFPVITTVNAGNPKNRFDLIKKTYYWRNEEEKYQLINTVKIPGKKIADKKLRSLLTGTTRDFEDYLSALWLLSSAATEKGVPMGTIVLFDPNSNKITFYENDIEEVYRWESSSKTLYNTLIIHCRNDIVPFLRVTLYIRILDLNTIHITYKDDSVRNSKKATNKNWTGKYLKTDKTMDNSILARTSNASANKKTIQLTGYYKDGTGKELFFNPPYFESKTSEGFSRGGFYLYNIGVNILQLKYINDRKEVYKSETFKYDFLVTKKDLKITRSLVLIPGTINVRGFSPSGKTYVRYEQVEQLEPEKKQSSTTP